MNTPSDNNVNQIVSLASGAFRPQRVALSSTADMDQGVNDYLYSILAPELCATKRPDNNLTRSRVKAITGYTNFPVNAGSTGDLLFIYRPHSAVTSSQVDVYAMGTNVSQGYNFLTTVPYSQDLSENYRLFRVVSGLLAVESSTVSTTTANLQGTMAAASCMEEPDFGALRFQSLASFASSASNGIGGVKLADGITVLACPGGDGEYLSPVNSNNEYSGSRLLVTQDDVAPVIGGTVNWNLNTVDLPTNNRGVQRVVAWAKVRTTVPNEQVSVRLNYWTHTADPTTYARVTTNFNQAKLFELPTPNDHDIYAEFFFETQAVTFEVDVLIAPSVGAATYQDVVLHFENWSLGQHGFASPCEIIAVDGATPGSELNLRLHTNFEVVPDSELAREVGTSYGSMDSYNDEHMAKLALINADQLGIKYVWPSPAYQFQILHGAFKMVAGRANLIAHASSIGDFFSNLWRKLKPMVVKGAPMIGSLFGPEGAVVGNAIGQIASLGSSEPSGRVAHCSGKEKDWEKIDEDQVPPLYEKVEGAAVQDVKAQPPPVPAKHYPECVLNIVNFMVFENGRFRPGKSKPSHKGHRPNCNCCGEQMTIVNFEQERRDSESEEESSDEDEGSESEDKCGPCEQMQEAAMLNGWTIIEDQFYEGPVTILVCNECHEGKAADGLLRIPTYNARRKKAKREQNKALRVAHCSSRNTTGYAPESVPEAPDLDYANPNDFRGVEAPNIPNSGQISKEQYTSLMAPTGNLDTKAAVEFSLNGVLGTMKEYEHKFYASSCAFPTVDSTGRAMNGLNTIYVSSDPFATQRQHPKRGPYTNTTYRKWLDVDGVPVYVDVRLDTEGSFPKELFAAMRQSPMVTLLKKRAIYISFDMAADDTGNFPDIISGSSMQLALVSAWQLLPNRFAVTGSVVAATPIADVFQKINVSYLNGTSLVAYNCDEDSLQTAVGAWSKKGYHIRDSTNLLVPARFYKDPNGVQRQAPTVLTWGSGTTFGQACAFLNSVLLKAFFDASISNTIQISKAEPSQPIDKGQAAQLANQLREIIAAQKAKGRDVMKDLNMPKWEQTLASYAERGRITDLESLISTVNMKVRAYDAPAKKKNNKKAGKGQSLSFTLGDLDL